jgi:trk system potassium uptake protein
VLLIALSVELVLFVALTGTFWFRHGESLVAAIELGGFHAVSAFNNAGFALFSDSLEGFVTDPFVNVIVATAVIAGAVGFPVLNDLRQWSRRPRAGACTPSSPCRSWLQCSSPAPSCC